MTYRDDLDAANARANAAERERDDLRHELVTLADAQLRPQLPLPERFRSHDGDETLTVSWRWLRARSMVSAAVPMMITSVAAWYAFHANTALGPAAAGVLLLYALGNAYRLATLLCNQTVLAATRDRLTITHGPLPWSRGCSLARAELEQLYSEEHETARGASYRLNAVERGGRRRKLVADLDDAGEARWLEISLERRLGIPDAPVVGELPR